MINRHSLFPYQSIKTLTLLIFSTFPLSKLSTYQNFPSPQLFLESFSFFLESLLFSPKYNLFTKSKFLYSNQDSDLWTFNNRLPMKQDDKLLALLDVVIDTYINKGEPIGSKFLNSLEDVDYAPSTLRKYLNLLEKQGMVYQPYNSSGRIPTIDGLKLYIETYLQQIEEENKAEVLTARENIKELVEMLGGLVDGVIIGFLRNDEYYHLGINNLLRDDLKEDYEETRNIIKFIEEKRIVKHIDSKILKKNQIYYTFLDDQNTIISTVYAKINMDGYDGILAIVGSTRVNYKKNVAILSQLLQKME